MNTTVTYEEYKKQIFQERGQRIAAAKSDSAKVGCITGQTPLGYRNNRTANGTEAIIDEEKSPLVKQAFLMAAEGRPFREILNRLTSLGLSSKRGGTLSLSSLHNMLTNPFYKGLVRHKEGLAIGQQEPLVSAELFDQVQKMLEVRKY